MKAKLHINTLRLQTKIPIPHSPFPSPLTEAEVTTGVHIHEQAFIPVRELVFSPQLLEYCKNNACGNYNKSWTCPPACESMEEQREKILGYQYVFVFTTVHELEDPFDYEGMMRGKESHTSLTIELKRKLNTPVYGAGSCPLCNPCAFPDPCPFPEKKLGSIEAAGINVTELSRAANIAYNNGPNTVTYFSMALLKQEPTPTPQMPLPPPKFADLFTGNGLPGNRQGNCENSDGCRTCTLNVFD